MALGALLLIFIRYKHSIVYVVSIVLLCGAIVTVINRVVGEYNLFNQLIVERLTIEDGQIAGNNRFSSDFEDEYERKKRRVPYGLAGNLIFLNMMEGMRVINVILVSMAW